jgi:hypothetical protein
VHGVWLSNFKQAENFEANRLLSCIKTRSYLTVMQVYRFKSDKESKIRTLKVDVDKMTGSEFCSFLSDQTFKGKKATCIFYPVNMDPDDVVEGVVIVDQSYAQKFKNTPESEAGEIVEAPLAIPAWSVRRWQSPPPPPRRPPPRRPPSRRWRSRSPRRRRRVRRHKKRRWERM